MAKRWAELSETLDLPEPPAQRPTYRALADRLHELPVLILVCGIGRRRRPLASGLACTQHDISVTQMARQACTGRDWRTGRGRALQDYVVADTPRNTAHDAVLGHASRRIAEMVM